MISQFLTVLLGMWLLYSRCSSNITDAATTDTTASNYKMIFDDVAVNGASDDADTNSTNYQ